MKVSPFSALRTVVNDDGAVILDIDHGLMSTLKPTGAYVWHRLRQSESPETIAAPLARETGEDLMLVQTDVREFIDNLKKKRLSTH